MLTILHRTVFRSLHTAVVWAMIPLALWGARPAAGCICADGHFELICKSGLSVSNSGHPYQQGKARCCCPSLVEKSTTQLKSCCSKGGSSHCATVSRDGSSGCCSPVVQHEILLSSVSQIDENHQSVPLCIVDFAEYAPTGTSLPGLALYESEHMPCGDIVVTFRRLLI